MEKGIYMFDEELRNIFYSFNKESNIRKSINSIKILIKKYAPKKGKDDGFSYTYGKNSYRIELFERLGIKE